MDATRAGVYCCESYARFSVIDTTHPAAPAVLASYRLPSYPACVAGAGQLALVGFDDGYEGWRDGGLLILRYTGTLGASAGGAEWGMYP